MIHYDEMLIGHFSGDYAQQNKSNQYDYVLKVLHYYQYKYVT